MALGNDEVVTVGGCAVEEIVMLKDCVPVLLFASFTCTVKDEVPEVVGVPAISPVDAVKLNPAGSEPDVTLHVYGVVPPDAVSVAEYAVLTVPLGSEVVVTVGGCGAAAIVMLSALVAVCSGELESAAFTVKDEAPACVGVPVMPPAAESPSPAGRAPLANDHE